jgi:sugar lactone lactonase YvrE
MLEAVTCVGLDESLGETLRTEDVRFSPSGRVLAVVATNGVVLLFAVDTSARPIRIGRCTRLHSTSLASPHGVDFLSEHLIVVANRAGWLTAYRVPSIDDWRDDVNVEPLREIDSAWFGRKGGTRNLEGRNVLCGPGSVRVRESEIFVACNHLNTVTVHPYRLRSDEIEIGDGVIVAQSGLEIPDGIALSHDGRWLAVSNHNDHGIEIVCLHDRARSGSLRDAGLRYPHGLCFDPSGRTLYVADAGERDLHAFVSRKGDWDHWSPCSASKLPAVEMEAFRKTKDASGEERFRKLEGGIKGVDVDRTGRVVATTCRHQTLRFFERTTAEAAHALTAW